GVERSRIDAPGLLPEEIRRLCTRPRGESENTLLSGAESTTAPPRTARTCHGHRSREAGFDTHIVKPGGLRRAREAPRLAGSAPGRGVRRSQRPGRRLEAIRPARAAPTRASVDGSGTLAVVTPTVRKSTAQPSPPSPP